MSADGDVKGAFPPDTGARVGIRDGTDVLVQGVPVNCGYLSPDMGDGASIALLRWQGAWLALGSILPAAPDLTTYMAGTGTTALTTANQAVPSTIITVTLTAGTKFHVVGVFHFNITTAAATVATGSLFVDGVAQSGNAVFSCVSSVASASVTQQWTGTLAAGTHTFELQALKTLNVGVITVVGSNTTQTLRLGA